MIASRLGRRTLATILAAAILVLASLGAMPSDAGELRAAMVATCPTSDAPASFGGKEALGGLLLGIASSFTGSLVDTGVAALKKVVNPDATTIEKTFLQNGLYAYVKGDPVDTSTTTTDQARLNRRIGCLVVAVGDFKQDATPWSLPFPVSKGKAAIAMQDLKSALSLSGPPMVYLEAAILQSPDKSAITWLPTKIYVGEFLNSSFWAGHSRGMQISVKLTKPGSDKPFYAQDFKYDAVQAGFFKDQDDLRAGSQGTWGVLPGPSSAKPDTVTPSPGLGSPFDPFNLTVQIVETPKPYKLAAAFADAVEANKGAIKTEIDQQIDPSKKQTATLTAQSAALTAVTTYVASWQKASDACVADKVKEAPGQVQCKVALDQATVDKTKADAACSAAKVSSCDEKDKLALPPPQKTQ